MKDKLYDTTFESGKNDAGFDYKDNLMKKSMSPRFFSGNTMVEQFISYINKMMYESIESVKIVRNFFNYTVKKDQKDIK
jgi:hypothetical protein